MLHSFVFKLWFAVVLLFQNICVTLRIAKLLGFIFFPSQCHICLSVDTIGMYVNVTHIHIHMDLSLVFVLCCLILVFTVDICVTIRFANSLVSIFYN